MCPTFRDATVLKNDDLVTIVDSPQPVRDEDTRSGLVFQYTVDILKEC